MTTGEAVELTDHLCVLSDRELSLDAVLERAELQLVEPRRLGAQRSLGCEIGEGRATPEREGVVERSYGGPGVDREEPARVPQQGLEAAGVELGGFGPEPVTSPAPLESLGPQCLPKV